MWALDKNVPMPSEENLKEMPIENSPKEKEEEKEEDTKDEKATKKLFPYMIRIIEYNDLKAEASKEITKLPFERKEK